MIEARELRIGNLVEYGDGEIIVDIDVLRDFNIYKASGIKPIPLTEVWLVMFGWKYFNGKTDGTLTMDTPCKLDIDFVEGRMQVKSHYEGFYRDLNIQHVHQLQNLYFALTGQELCYS